MLYIGRVNATFTDKTISKPFMLFDKFKLFLLIFIPGCDIV